MANDVYKTVSSCTVYERCRVQSKLKRQLQMFLLNDHLEIVAINIWAIDPYCKRLSAAGRVDG